MKVALKQKVLFSNILIFSPLSEYEFIIEGTCFGTKVRSITSYTKSARVANSRGKNQYM